MTDDKEMVMSEEMKTKTRTTEFVVTFGVQYGSVADGRVEHEALPGVSSEHYLTVIAEDENQARALTAAVTKGAWAFMYTGAKAESVVARHCPAGEFMRIEVSRG